MSSIAQAYRTFLRDVAEVVTMNENGMVTDHEAFCKVTDLVVRNNSSDEERFVVREYRYESGEEEYTAAPVSGVRRYCFVKQCCVCSNKYYVKDIDLTNFQNITTNDAVAIVHGTGENVGTVQAVLQSICDVCAATETVRNRSLID